MSLQLVKKGVLVAPSGFWKMHPQDYKRICNGAGPKGWGWLVPDTMWGLRVTRAADIHDFMYFWKLWPREFCDDVFLKNLLAIINQRGGFLKYPRRLRAHTYYKAVRLWGGAAYGG